MSSAVEGPTWQALLVTPSLGPALASDVQVQIPQMPAAAESMLDALAPYIAELVEHGTLLREAIMIMAEQALGGLGTVPADKDWGAEWGISAGFTAPGSTDMPWINK